VPEPRIDTPEVASLLDFSNRVVAVTGAGAGIGAGIALRFAEAGASVVIACRSNQSGAERVANTIGERGGRARVHAGDLAVEAEAERLVSAAVAGFGGLDVVINNAGSYPLHGLLEMKEPEWRSVIDANLTTVHLVTQAVARWMVDAKRPGAIVNIASIEAQNPATLHAHYNAAKAGVVMHTRTAAAELGRHGIRVNSVSPGLIDREGLEDAWPDGVSRYLASVPLSRLGQPADIADACLFLASPAARWITGADLVVDGGVLTSSVY
jgi:NAD(P)-dependent dehydrogenase (short-subunit alcohol dehydrogenase family)